MTLRVGVVGTGVIGQDHIRRVTEVLSGAEIIAVTDTDAARAQAVAAAVGARQYEDSAALIAADDVDAVMVTSWGPAHAAAVLPAIAAGKPVFCEKPLAPTQDGCLRIMDAEVKAGRRLVQVGFMRRYDPAYRALKAELDAGAIGAPLMVHAAHRNATVPDHYVSDMVVADTMVHDIDVARWLLDDEVARVRVFAGRVNAVAARRGLRDPIFAVMEMKGGAIATVEVSVNIGYGYDIRGEVSGETGVLELAQATHVVVKRGGAFAGRVPEDWRERFATAYDIEVGAWIKAAAAGGATGPSVWDGYAITAVADAATAAAKSGAAVEVTLAERPALYR